MSYAIVTASTAPIYDSFDSKAKQMDEANQGEKLVLHARVDNMTRVVKLSDNSMGWMHNINFKVLPETSVKPLHSHVPK